MNSSNKNKEETSLILNSRNWYLVETLYHSEKKAVLHLHNRNFEVYLPLQPLKKRTAKETQPLFPNYVFVHVDPDDPRWNEIRSAIGVKSFVGAAGKPCRAPIGLVEGIKRKEVFGVVQLGDKKEARATVPAHRKGDRFKVLEGSFAGFEGLFEKQPDAKRVVLLLSLFGRFSKIDFLPHEVQPLEPPRESQHV